MTLCKPCSTFGESNGKTSKFQPKGYSPKIRYQIAIASSVSLFPAGELLVKGEPGPEIITRKSWDFTRPHNFSPTFPIFGGGLRDIPPPKNGNPSNRPQKWEMSLKSPQTLGKSPLKPPPKMAHFWGGLRDISNFWGRFEG